MSLDDDRKTQRLTAEEINSRIVRYTSTPAEQQFLDGLTELTKRTGVTVHGCGCCGFSFLLDDRLVIESGRYTLSDYATSLSWGQP